MLKKKKKIKCFKKSEAENSIIKRLKTQPEMEMSVHMETRGRAHVLRVLTPGLVNMISFVNS